jgi:hypothetical protein
MYQGKFWRILHWKMLAYFMAIWSNGICCGHFAKFMVIWYIFYRFGMLYREKSGNHEANVIEMFILDFKSVWRMSWRMDCVTWHLKNLGHDFFPRTVEKWRQKTWRRKMAPKLNVWAPFKIQFFRGHSSCCSTKHGRPFFCDPGIEIIHLRLELRTSNLPNYFILYTK